MRPKHIVKCVLTMCCVVLLWREVVQSQVSTALYYNVDFQYRLYIVRYTIWGLIINQALKIWKHLDPPSSLSQKSHFISTHLPWCIKLRIFCRNQAWAQLIYVRPKTSLTQKSKFLPSLNWAKLVFSKACWAQAEPSSEFEFITRYKPSQPSLDPLSSLKFPLPSKPKPS